LAFHSGREADHSPPSSAEVKEWVELYLHSSNTPSWRGAQREHRDNFTFTFTLTSFTLYILCTICSKSLVWWLIIQETVETVNITWFVKQI
jgi:hypothetical protein